MFVAVRCADVAASARFYKELGMAPQPYATCRENQGTPFEPAQPPGSQCVVVASSPHDIR